jgi:hypothetical protein
MRWAHHPHPPCHRWPHQSTVWILAMHRCCQWRRPRRHPHCQLCCPPLPHFRRAIAFARSKVCIEEEQGAPVCAEHDTCGGVLLWQRMGTRVSGAGGWRACVLHTPQGGDIPLASCCPIHVVREVGLVSAIRGVQRGRQSDDAPLNGPKVLGLHWGGGNGGVVDNNKRGYQISGGSC